MRLRIPASVVDGDVLLHFLHLPLDFEYFLFEAPSFLFGVSAGGFGLFALLGLDLGQDASFVESLLGRVGLLFETNGLLLDLPFGFRFDELAALGLILSGGVKVAFDLLSFFFRLHTEPGFAVRLVPGFLVFSLGLGDLGRKLLGGDLGLAANPFVQLSLLGFLFSLFSLSFGLLLGLKGCLSEIIGTLFSFFSSLHLAREALGLGLVFRLFIGDEAFHLGFDLAAHVGLDTLLCLDRLLLGFFRLFLGRGQLLDQHVGLNGLRFGLGDAVLGVEKFLGQMSVRQKLGSFAGVEIGLKPFSLRCGKLRERIRGLRDLGTLLVRRNQIFRIGVGDR